MEADAPMQKTAIEQARARLRKAKRALSEIKDVTDLGVFRASWSDFLLAVSSVYSKLEQGRQGKWEEQRLVWT
jgi:hypothetical protein